MIPHGVDVFVGLDPIDLRWGFERLGGLVAERIGRDLRGGALFLFFGRRRAALKILFFDGSGLCLFYKRLDRGTFRVPEAPQEGDVAIQIDDRMLEDLLDGIDVEAPVRRRRIH
jgi:transposase